MAVEEFKFKIARAKDLPLSWFELVLCPDKFRAHLKALEGNPDAEPTALQLIVVFLEKAGCIEGQPQSAAPENSSASALDARRKTLVSCALFVACFLRWDLASFERGLAPAVLYSLLSLLTQAHPLILNAPLSVASSIAVTAHVLYHLWLLRYVVRHDVAASVKSARGNGGLVEVSCASPDQVFTLASSQVERSMEFLTGVLQQQRVKFRLPPPSLSLPLLSGAKAVEGGETIELELPRLKKISTDTMLCQLHYAIGSFHFKCDGFSEALRSFSRCREMLPSLATPPSLVDPDRLCGYVLACECVLGEEVKAESRLVEVERLRAERSEDLVRVLLRDNMSRELSSVYRTNLEIEAADWSKTATTETHTADSPIPPAAKRVKLDQSDFRTVPLHERLCVCNAVRTGLVGETTSPRFWQLLRRGGTETLRLVLWACDECVRAGAEGPAGAERQGPARAERQYLQAFLRSACCAMPEPAGALRMLADSLSAELFPPGDLREMQRFFAPVARLPGDVGRVATDEGLTDREKERRITTAATSQELVVAMEAWYSGVPSAERKAAALKWTGSEEGFAPLETIKAPPLEFVTYNALVHRAQLLRTAKNYEGSLEFLGASGRLLGGSGLPVSPRARQLLEAWHADQTLCLEMLSVLSQPRPAAGGRQDAQPFFAPDLIARAKACYHGNQSESSPTVQIASAFLLNAHQYSFMSGAHDLQSPGKVAPRLALLAQCVSEGEDLRRPTRELFEAVQGVFSPPHNVSGRRVDVLTKLRAQQDLFVASLREPLCLSLLLAALARLWNVLTKPEIEILSEYRNYWPTAIGNASSYDPSHVFRALSSTLSHALALRPRNTAWLSMQADTCNAVGDHGNALRYYLEAGDVNSCHFENEVSPEVWSQQTYRRIIDCCSKMSYHTHAAIFCQFLEPIDYELALGILQGNTSSATEALFGYFWDMGLIEYLVYLHSKRGDTRKSSVAIQVAGQQELNFNNSDDVIGRAIQVRRRGFLREMVSLVLAK